MANYPTAGTDRRVDRAALDDAVRAVFSTVGMAPQDAALLSDSLVHADLRGVHSHGVLRVPDYVAKMNGGGVDPRGAPKIVSAMGGAVVVDGDNTMGQIGGRFAMHAAMDAAGEHGVAFAALRGSNHCGALDWHTLLAAEQGMIGIAGSNALPTMAPVGGVDKIVGMNPISFAAPRAGARPFVLDLAFGATAHGKIRVYHQKGIPIPEGWATDPDGNPTRDAGLALDGLILPLGQHKGIALAMMVGILSTLLSGAAYGTRLGNMVDGPRPGVDGQFFLVLDIAAFPPVDEFKAALTEIVDEVHGSRPREPGQTLLIPGEMEERIEADYGANGIRLPGSTVDDILAVGRARGVPQALLDALPAR